MCDIYPLEIYPPWMQYILFAEAVIGAGIGLTIIQTVVYARVEILCESSHYTQSKYRSHYTHIVVSTGAIYREWSWQ